MNNPKLVQPATLGTLAHMADSNVLILGGTPPPPPGKPAVKKWKVIMDFQSGMNSLTAKPNILFRTGDIIQGEPGMVNMGGQFQAVFAKPTVPGSYSETETEVLPISYLAPYTGSQAPTPAAKTIGPADIVKANAKQIPVIGKIIQSTFKGDVTNTGITGAGNTTVSGSPAGPTNIIPPLKHSHKMAIAGVVVIIIIIILAWMAFKR
jgi:hypothetical protein